MSPVVLMPSKIVFRALNTAELNGQFALAACRISNTVYEVLFCKPMVVPKEPTLKVFAPVPPGVTLNPYWAAPVPAKVELVK
jgi:hypothetical protein